MAALIVSQVLGQLGSILAEEVKHHGRLVVGAEKDVKKLTSSFTTIEAQLLDAEERQLTQETVKLWVERLKDVSYEIDDVLDEWRTEILRRRIEGGHHDEHAATSSWFEMQLDWIADRVNRVCPFLPAYCFSCREIGLHHDIGSRIKELNESLDDIAGEKDRYQFIAREATFQTPERVQTGPTINYSEVKGRVDETDELLKKLLDDHGHGSVNIGTISILGMGGLGKTTLAKLVYNNEMVTSHFQKRIWVCVSEPLDQIEVARAILKSLTGDAPERDALLSDMLEQIQIAIRGKRFLLVLDDVWESSRRKWEELMSSVSYCSSGSKILVTTRREDVSRALGCVDSDVLRLGRMSMEECKEIFSHVAFHGWTAEGRERVKDICEDMVERCKGLPLAVKVMAGILQFKKSRKEWLQVLHSKMWDLEEAKRDVFAPIALSYYDLPPAIRQCFQFCAIYPKDTLMSKDRLVKQWVAHGFLRSTKNQDVERIGEEYFEVLAMRSFFQDLEKEWGWRLQTTSCKMHDMVHDFAQLVSRNDEYVSMTIEGVEDFTAAVTFSSNATRHLSIEISPGNSASMCTSLFDSTNHLRGFRLRNDGHPDVPLVQLFAQLCGVRSLDLKRCSLMEIPPAINKLIHLRHWHLDLSMNMELTELAEEICELYNLWTLVLDMNHSLRKLPDGMDKLVNLKNLHNDEVPACLPRSISKLTSLKTLHRVPIVALDGNGDGRRLGVGDLEKMNQLQGTLHVTGLGEVVDCSEVERAQFSRKELLNCLALDFRVDGCLVDEEFVDRRYPDTQRMELEEQVLEAVKPPTNLEQLYLGFYLGRSASPAWMMSLINLSRINFNCFPNLRRLTPELGNLPSLEELSFSRMSRVKKVGREFITAAFPKLKVLEFESMESWKVWEEWDHELIDTVMPLLRCLKLRCCGALKQIPNDVLRKTTLERLEIDGSSGGFGSYRFDLQHPEMLPSEAWQRISHVPSIVFDGIDIRKHFKTDIDKLT